MGEGLRKARFSAIEVVSMHDSATKPLILTGGSPGGEGPDKEVYTPDYRSRYLRKSRVQIILYIFKNMDNQGYR